MPRRVLPLLLLALLAASLGGCALPGGERDDAEAPAADDEPRGPRFLLVVDNQVSRMAVVEVRVTGPRGGVDVEATVPAPASQATRETLPLVVEGAHRVDAAYDVGEGGQTSSGAIASAFDTLACGEGSLPRVTLRLFERDGVVHAGADAACVAASGTT